MRPQRDMDSKILCKITVSKSERERHGFQHCFLPFYPEITFMWSGSLVKLFLYVSLHYFFSF